jgi:hypothetical protein
MLDLDETVGRSSARPQRGRIRCDPVRVLRFDLFELVQQPVELQVADDRRIQDVIAIIVLVDLLFEVFVTGMEGVFGHIVIIAWKKKSYLCYLHNFLKETKDIENFLQPFCY